MDVGEIGDLLEGEEGDAKRQDDVKERPIEACRGIEARDEEIGIFEIGENAEIPRKAQDEERFALQGLPARDGMRVHPVYQHRDDEEEQETWAPPGIEHHRGEEEPG